MTAYRLNFHQLVLHDIDATIDVPANAIGVTVSPLTESAAPRFVIAWLDPVE